jgi:tRNA A58 N-methylase Trm61
MKLTDIIIKHSEIESIEGDTVIYKNGITIHLSKPELNELLMAFSIHGVGQDIPVRA